MLFKNLFIIVMPYDCDIFQHSVFIDTVKNMKNWTFTQRVYHSINYMVKKTQRIYHGRNHMVKSSDLKLVSNDHCRGR